MADMRTRAPLFLHFQQQEMSKTQAQMIWVVMFRRENGSTLNGVNYRTLAREIKA